MSILPPSISGDLQFYLSGPQPCPYLPGRIERKLFTRLDHADPALNGQINAVLCRAGFRRSHTVAYRPACSHCQACVPVRIPVKFFQPTKSMRRIGRYNADLRWARAAPQATDELFELFTAYQTARHADSDMARMDKADLAAMLEESNTGTLLYQLRDGAGRLWGCMLADSVGDGLSAVYSFFLPTEPRRSLGTHLVLSLIDEAQKQDLSFVYLGYWIAESPKMAYKNRFQPLHYLGRRGWDWTPDQG